MNDALLEKIIPELRSALIGKQFSKVYQLGPFELAILFEADRSVLLFICVDPSEPRTYLIKRRGRDLKKLAEHPSRFAIALGKTLPEKKLDEIELLGNERALEFIFSGSANDETSQENYLVIQLTGRSANLFLLDGDHNIVDSVRKTKGTGQQPSDRYSPPARTDDQAAVTDRQRQTAISTDTNGRLLSEMLDDHYQKQAEHESFVWLARAARNKHKLAVARLERLSLNLKKDLTEHGDAEKWKRFGDLLLANAATAKRSGDKIAVTDFFDESLPLLEIEADPNDSITEVAEKYFGKYTKARNAAREIAKRLEAVTKGLDKLTAQNDAIENAIAARDIEFLEQFGAKPKIQPPPKRGSKQKVSFAGSRSFISSDGFEVLVGKKAKDNDFLTFRIAGSLDTWMHAADYPGSHVVIRNPNRKEVPPRTLLEAAQIAAFYSQGKKQPKAAVHYTQKKFVNKPKGAAPGLVSLASFKTILVEPKIEIPQKETIR